MADSLGRSGKLSDELLEFCFRRIFDSMPEMERDVLRVLSLYNTPLTSDAIYVACGKDSQTFDSLEALVDDALVQRLFDSDQNDFCFTIISLTRRFVADDLAAHNGLDERLRSRLTDWYEARDITDAAQKLVARELRQGRRVDDTALVDLALAAERKGELDSAERLYQQAMQQCPRSWRAARNFGEYYRHKRPSASNALHFYEIAAANAPSRGRERGVIFREWAMLLRDSGAADAINRATIALEAALAEMPDDGITIYQLASMYDRKGVYKKVISLLAPCIDSVGELTRDRSLPLLKKAYERTNHALEAARLKVKYERLREQNGFGRDLTLRSKLSENWCREWEPTKSSVRRSLVLLGRQRITEDSLRLVCQR